jgi:hypothetical protein
MTIPSEGANVTTGFQYYVNLYIETKTTEPPDGKKGASVKNSNRKQVGAVSTNQGSTKLGAHVVEYRPELTILLSEAV